MGPVVPVSAIAEDDAEVELEADAGGDDKSGLVSENVAGAEAARTCPGICDEEDVPKDIDGSISGEDSVFSGGEDGDGIISATTSENLDELDVQKMGRAPMVIDES